MRGQFDQFARQASADGMMGACPFPLHNVIPQPPADFEPFNYPLVHTILLVTAYSESVEGLRTTIDSLATTDYPNSHKVILVIADGMVKGSGNNLTTPEIALGMMRDLIVPAEDVEAHSYVAIADGHKRHNRAKIFAGFYDYDNNTVEMSKQQRVPMILVAKVGNALEAHEAKPGNRGKRDSQIVLMAFLQKVMFDERMSSFEYEFFNSLWRCTGVSPDRYETVLCVDADTKVFPDSVSRMNSCMVNDPEIMGLCGETKIANKGESWVTMIQGAFSARRSFAHRFLTFVATSFRVLRVSSSHESVRIGLWRSHLSPRMLLDVSSQVAERRRRILGPDSRQSRYRRALLGERRRYAAQEESAPTRRGSISHDAHATNFPSSKDDVLSASGV